MFLEKWKEMGNEGVGHFNGEMLVFRGWFCRADGEVVAISDLCGPRVFCLFLSKPEQRTGTAIYIDFPVINDE